MKTTIAARLSVLLIAEANALKANNQEWYIKHRDAITALMGDAPSGSGIDNGTKLDDATTPNRLVFNADFHHMDEHGYYDGWTDHQVIVTPSLAFGVDVRVTGRNRNDIKDHLAECFRHWLSSEVTV